MVAVPGPRRVHLLHEGIRCYGGAYWALRLAGQSAPRPHADKHSHNFIRRPSQWKAASRFAGEGAGEGHPLILTAGRLYRISAALGRRRVHPDTPPFVHEPWLSTLPAGASTATAIQPGRSERNDIYLSGRKESCRELLHGEREFLWSVDTPGLQTPAAR